MPSSTRARARWLRRVFNLTINYNASAEFFAGTPSSDPGVTPVVTGAPSLVANNSFFNQNNGSSPADTGLVTLHAGAIMVVDKRYGWPRTGRFPGWQSLHRPGCQSDLLRATAGSLTASIQAGSDPLPSNVVYNAWTGNPSHHPGAVRDQHDLL